MENGKADGYRGSMLISIVMPAYNAENTVKETIQSVLMQTYTEWELIVIDDGSVDSTPEIVETLAASEPRIYCIHNKKNSGVSKARNIGIAETHGEWIAFLDSDDMWEPDKLEKQVDLLGQKPDADIIFTGSSFINRDGKKSSYHLQVPQSVTYRKLLKQNIISCSSAMVRKKWILKYPMAHDDMHEDFAVWLQILKDGGRAYGINEPLLIYRMSENSKSGNKKKAAVMTYKVYRYLGLNPIAALYNIFWYAWKNMKKYRLIRKRNLP